MSHLVLVEILVDEFVLALLLEGDDDQSHEDVDEEEGEDYEVDDVEDRHLHAEARRRTFVLKRGVHRVLQNTADIPCDHNKKQLQSTMNLHNFKQK